VQLRLKIARESRVESVALDCIRHYDDDDDDDETDGSEGNNHNDNDDEENEDDNEDDDDRETSEVSLVRTLRSICCESIVWLTHVWYAININCKKIDTNLQSLFVIFEKIVQLKFIINKFHFAKRESQ